jgi:hypothetical protein
VFVADVVNELGVAFDAFVNGKLFFDSSENAGDSGAVIGIIT